MTLVVDSPIIIVMKNTTSYANITVTPTPNPDSVITATPTATAKIAGKTYRFYHIADSGNDSVTCYWVPKLPKKLPNWFTGKPSVGFDVSPGFPY